MFSSNSSTKNRGNALDAIIVGGGASGLMCALTASRRGKKIILIDHSPRLGDRIAISGGGQCNFTNLSLCPDDYVSDNPRFLYSPLSAFTASAAIHFFAELGLDHQEREQGQIFCRQGGDGLRQTLLQECRLQNVTMVPMAVVERVEREAHGFQVTTSKGSFHCGKLVVASGGLSYVKLGASDLGYRLARQFGHHIIPTRPGLVPLLYSAKHREKWQSLAGISLPIVCTVNKKSFAGDVLFTHHGLSGPVILTVSNYWRSGDEIIIDWLPGKDIKSIFTHANPSDTCRSLLARTLPKRMLGLFFAETILQKPLCQLSRTTVQTIIAACHNWPLIPQKTAGYDKAEVTNGGIDTREIDNKTMQSRIVPGLYFCGEVLDVTGNLGGYNLHWAWASGHLAAGAI